MDADLRSDLERAAPTEFNRLSAAERERFFVHGERLIRRAHWEGARDVEVTDQMVLTVSSHAALLTAGFEPQTQPFLNVKSIVLHARTIVTRQVQPGPVRGVYTSGPQYLAGQSGHGRGPVLLDWQTVQRQVAAPGIGANVVYHEFAHRLDMLDGTVDGTPPLDNADAQRRWVDVCTAAYDTVRAEGSPVLRDYAGTSPAEFFAVATEVFFNRPMDLCEHEPALYRELREYYRQDPATRHRALAG